MGAEAERGVPAGCLVDQVLDNFSDKSPMDAPVEMIGMDGEYDQQENEGYLKVDGYKQAEGMYDQMEGKHDEYKIGCNHEGEHVPEQNQGWCDCKEDE